ncbi:hypothetical protein VZT92_015107 [Zoarces viviparus]|uniref:Peptidase A2 domain-containing protein n=1 Tax=Zoarces viviparus TaxID=48416 RepID=A0AAW1EVE6_ZOAVI
MTKSLLGVWAAWPPGPTLPLYHREQGKRVGDRIIGTMRAPGTLSRPLLNDEATQLSDQVGAPRPPEDFDGQLERLVVLGQTWIGDCWYAPLTIGGTCCSALVDTGSSATLVRPDVVKNKTVIFPTIVKLQSPESEPPWLGKQ